MCLIAPVELQKELWRYIFHDVLSEIRFSTRYWRHELDTSPMLYGTNHWLVIERMYAHIRCIKTTLL